MDKPAAGACIVLYDGDCALCNGAVTFILQREKRGELLFASLQGEFGTAFLNEYKNSPANLDTIWVVKEYATSKQRILYRSDAVLYIARQLRAGWPLLSIFRVVPRFVRDWLYDVVSFNRYRIWGRHDQCVLPKPQWKARFLD